MIKAGKKSAGEKSVRGTNAHIWYFHWTWRRSKCTRLWQPEPLCLSLCSLLLFPSVPLPSSFPSVRLASVYRFLLWDRCSPPIRTSLGGSSHLAAYWKNSACSQNRKQPWRQILWKSVQFSMARTPQLVPFDRLNRLLHLPKHNPIDRFNIFWSPRSQYIPLYFFFRRCPALNQDTWWMAAVPKMRQITIFRDTSVKQNR